MNRPINETFLALLLLLSLTCTAIAQTSPQGGVGKPVGPATTNKPTEAAPMTVLPSAAAKEKEKNSSSTTSRAVSKPLAPQQQVQQTPRPLTKRLTMKERGV